MSVTLISLAIAAALAVVVMKLLRDDRRRSEARIAALTELAEEPEVERSPAPRRPPAAPIGEPAASLTIRPTRRVADLEIRPLAAAAPAVSDLFETPAQASPWGRRFAVIGVIVLVGSATLFALMQRRGGVETEPAHAAQEAGAQSGSPLELVSLRHSREGETLTITGLVQNPKAGAPQTRLVVTAVVFGPDGTFLAGGRAPLDYTRLNSGDESPFVITVPVKGTVARYRVGFRAEDGNVVAHVDRRSDSNVRKAGL